MSMEVLRAKMLKMLELGLEYEREFKGSEVTATVTFEIANPDTGNLVKFPINIQQYINGDRRDLAQMLMVKMSKEFPPDYVYQIHRAYMRHVAKEENVAGKVKDMPGRLEVVSVAGKDREGNVAFVYVEVLEEAGVYGEVQWLPDNDPEHVSMLVLDMVEMRE